MKVKINNRSMILDPAHEGDAGYDVIAAKDPEIVGVKTSSGPWYSHIDYIEYDTNLMIEPDIGFHTLAFPRSSISSKNLILCNSVGLIDNGYRGTVKFRFKYVPQPADYYFNNYGIAGIEVDLNKIYKSGDKIGQLVFMPTIIADVVTADNFSKTNRSAGGFGSTGS